MITVDGSKFEGGGSILRNSIALSLFTNKPVRITNIRKNRKTPGLKKQHLKVVELAKQLSDGKATGLFQGSVEVEFYPGKLSKSKNIEINIQTAGSTTLLLKSLFIPLFLSNNKYVIKTIGGTDVIKSPSFDYFKNVFLNNFNEFGSINCELLKRGYFPKGKGMLRLSLKKKENKKLTPLELINRGELGFIKCIMHSSKSLESINPCPRMLKSVQALLGELDKEIIFEQSYSETESEDYGLTLIGYYESGLRTGFCRTSESKFSPEKLAEYVVDEFKEDVLNGKGVDKYLADQLIPLLGIVKGSILTSEITDHSRANIYVCEKFLNIKYDVNEIIKEIKV